MNKKVLIVEDQFVEANDLQLILEKSGYEVCGIARSVPLAQEFILKQKPDLVLLDIFLKGKLTGIDLARELNEKNIAFIFLSANSNEEILAAARTTEPQGFIVKPFREKDLLVTLDIAQYRHEHSCESKYRREAQLQLQLEKTIFSNADLNFKILQIGKLLQPEFPFDFMAIDLNRNDGISSRWAGFLRVGFDEYQTIGLNELSTISGTPVKKLTTLHSITQNNRVAEYFNNNEFEKVCQGTSAKKLFREIFQLNSHLHLPLQLKNESEFSFGFYSRRPDAYGKDQLSVFYRIQAFLNSGIERMLAAERSSSSEEAESAPSDEENKNLKSIAFKGIIGSSHLLLNVFDAVTQVSPFDTAVLILGESGTGKERIAECVHDLSPRRGGAFIKLNCATLPPTLIESELFGHEKGSFTGAIEKRIGKFEQANGGTIFLDEIGEMPIDLQVKLLRVLQEMEIEPIGGRKTIKINVRIIAATNRNLEKEVAEGRFRLDLYYRLNVFPIELPPLRKRTEDIPALADYFIKIFNRKAGKRITGLSDRVLRNMTAYHWPGNIRELENLIERSVLLTKGQVIDDLSLPANQENKTLTTQSDFHMKTINENEKDYIMAVLKKCGGRIWGIGGAAEVLKIPPSTLKSKMKKLGIKKEYVE